jgi:hypothetical protein
MFAFDASQHGLRDAPARPPMCGPTGIRRGSNGAGIRQPICAKPAFTQTAKGLSVFLQLKQSVARHIQILDEDLP